MTAPKNVLKFLICPSDLSEETPAYLSASLKPTYKSHTTLTSTLLYWPLMFKSLECHRVNNFTELSILPRTL